MKSLKLLFYSFFIVIILTQCDDWDIFDKNKPPEDSYEVGDTIWIHQVPKLEKSTYLTHIPFAIGKNGDIYYTASGGTVTWMPSRIYAINKDDGTLKWKTEPLAIWHINSNIVVGDDGTIYILSYTKLYSIDPNDGTFNWVWEVPKSLFIDGAKRSTYGEVGALVLCNNGDLVFKTIGAGSYYRAMYCVDKSGNTRWFRFIPHNTMPISIGNTGIIFDFEAFEGIRHIAAIDPHDGYTIWKKRLDYSGNGNSNIVVTTNGDLICDVGLDSLYSISPSGNINWKIKSGTYSKDKYISPSGIIYGYNQWQGLLRFEELTGAKQELLHVRDELVIDQDGKIYNAGGDGVVIYDKEGNKVNELSFHVTTYASTLTLSKDNIVYVGGPDMKIIAIQGDSPIATKGWPCFAHDNRNTFNYSKRNN